MKVTIKTVADMAGVSKSTVSRVMNNSKPVSEEIRKRVMDAIEATNFKPSSVARSLSNKKTHLIGVIIPDISNPVFSEIMKGIEDQAHAEGYNVLLCNARNDTDKELEYIDILKDKEVDGMIFSGIRPSEAMREALQAFHKPITLIGYEDGSNDFSTIIIDNFGAAYEVGVHFIQKNHKHIGMIYGPLEGICSGLRRFEGFKQAVEEHEGHFYGVEGSYKVHDGYEGTKQLLVEQEDITAIFCANDEMAIGCIKALHEMNKSIPEEIEVIGFDDIYLSEIYVPSLTTVRQEFEEKGLSAMKKLIGIINGDETVEKIVHGHQLIFRESTRT